MMIGVVEVLKVGQQIIEANRKSAPNAAFGIYATVFLLYFLACFPISMFSKYLERKWKSWPIAAWIPDVMRIVSQNRFCKAGGVALFALALISER